MNDERSKTPPPEDGYENGEEAEELAIDGTLDLHMFRPRETRDLVHDYVEECRRRGILDLRIVHGKGVGVQREIVHSVLREREDVESFRLGDESSGSWGATLVRLKRPSAERQEER